MQQAEQSQTVSLQLPRDDWQRLERYAARYRLTRQDVLTRHLKPLFAVLEELDQHDDDEPPAA